MAKHIKKPKKLPKLNNPFSRIIFKTPRPEDFIGRVDLFSSDDLLDIRYGKQAKGSFKNISSK